MHILLVEDDPDLARILQIGLQRQGHTVDVVGDGLRAEGEAAAGDYDVVVVDWMLPGQDGRTLVERLRADGSTVPVLMLTALDEVEHRVAGLEAGADDYLTKPFDLKELLARLLALARRAATYGGDAIQEAGPLRLDLRRRAAHLGERPLDLRPKEFELLELLARHAGTPVTRAAIARDVWADPSEVNDATINMTVSTLRQKLQRAQPSDGAVEIETVRGSGYRLVTP